MEEALLDALIDSLKLLPFLAGVYVLIEILEHKASSKMSSSMLRGKLSPLIGSAVGIIPQCGFSVVATKLYTRGAIAMGTLLSVYISTSDEAIAVLISDYSSWDKLLPLIGIKFAFAIVVGYAVNAFCGRKVTVTVDENVCVEGCHHHTVGKEEKEKDHKHGAKQLIIHSLIHTLEAFLYILAVNAVLNVVIYYVGEQSLENFLDSVKYLQPIFAAIVGLIPSCAASVVIARMYAIGSLSLGAALSGLCVSAGIGTAVLIKENPPKNTVVVLSLLIGLSIVLGEAVTLISSLF